MTTRYVTSFGSYVVDGAKGIVYGLRGEPIRGRDKDGYVIVMNRSRGFEMKAHRMIWIAVNGQIPEGLQINHINGVQWDNRIENLELVTPSENTLHAYRIGRCNAKGERNGRAIGKRRRLSREAA